MPDELFEFRWPVEEGGYSWVRTQWQERFPGKLREPDLFLTSAVPGGVPRPVIQYYPLLRHTGLFRHFAATEMNREGIQKFANTYGLLGGNVSKDILLPGKGAIQVSFQNGKGPEESFALGTGETLHSWAIEISAMQQALVFWDLVAAENRQQLSQHVRWTRADAVRIDFPQGGGSWIATPDIRSYRLQHMSKWDVIRPALFYIQETINRHMAGRVSPRLLWDTKRERMSLYIVPNSLVGALWLQFARAVDGDKKYERCLECRTWFEVSLDAARTNRRYCRNACRFKAYRHRQAEARRLLAEGMSIKKIAKRLDSDAATVRSWVGQPK